MNNFLINIELLLFVVDSLFISEVSTNIYLMENSPWESGKHFVTLKANISCCHSFCTSLFTSWNLFALPRPTSKVKKIIIMRKRLVIGYST